MTCASTAAIRSSSAPSAAARCRVRVGGLLQKPHRVLAASAKRSASTDREQLRAAGQPRPAVVVGEPRERREGVGQPLREILGGAPDVLAAVVHRHPAVTHGRGLWDKRVVSRALTGANVQEGDCRLGVLAFGDSITNGGGELQWGVALQSWALWVARGLGLPFTCYAVDGASCRTWSHEQIPAFSRRSLPGAALRGRLPVHRGQRRALGAVGRRGLRRRLPALPAVLIRALRPGAHDDRAGRPGPPAGRREGRGPERPRSRGWRPRSGALVVDLRSWGARNLVMTDHVHPTAFGQIDIAERALDGAGARRRRRSRSAVLADRLFRPRGGSGCGATPRTSTGTRR